MQFGNKHSIIVIDKIGSTKTNTQVFRNGDAVTNTTIYDVRKRVADYKQELAEFIKFRQDHKENCISFSIEYPKEYTGDWYYVVLRFKGEF